MPTNSLVQLPRSRSAEEFENMCADILTVIYKISFSIYGRQGQEQNGIDLFASNTEGHHIVAQCKNYYACSYKKLQEQLSKDIASAKNLPFSISEFIAMTSLDRDVATQNLILNLSTTFDVKILFWEDIQKAISGETNLLHKYYPQFVIDSSIPIEYRNELISNSIALKQAVKMLNSGYLHYTPAVQYSDDINVYNTCVSANNAVWKLYQIQQKWYLQLEEKNITKYIDKIVENMPEFSDETTDRTGAAMIYTITEFLDFFAASDKTEIFVTYCDEIINRAKKM